LKHHLRPSPLDAPATRSWGSEPGASPSFARRGPILAGTLCLALVLAACSAASAPPLSPSPTPGASPSASTPPGVQPPIEDVEEAIAAVAAMDPQFLGYKPLDPDVIGASAWVEVADGEDVVILTFVRGWGDCPAGCINRAYAKFEVHKPDGTVIKLCEWQQGEEAVGTPC
jgi:hypothetical protein